jgi:hypothetical protein
MSDFKGFSTKKTVFKQNSKGEDQQVFNITPEETARLIERLTELAGSERGVKFSFNTREKEGNYGSFLSTYFFVDEIQAPGQGFQGKGQGQGGFQKKGTFKPKAKGQTEATKAAAARTLNTQVE